MNQSSTELPYPPSGRPATPVTSAADAERPIIPRTVFVGGELLIGGVAVCPVCLEDKGSEFCRCAAGDTLVDLDVESLRHVRVLGLAVAR